MDTLLYNGDFARDGRGYPIPCSGAQELLQRALIRLTVQKGSFIYDPDLGSRLSLLKNTTRNMEARALELIQEALLELPQLTPVGVSIQPQQGRENLSLTVLLNLEGQSSQLEVIV